MKNIWKEEDIKAGLLIIRESSPKDSENLSFAATVCFKIGYDNSHLKKYGKISFLTDGWYCPLTETKAEYAKWLNEDCFGYRPLTIEETIKLLFHKKSQLFY